MKRSWTTRGGVGERKSFFRFSARASSSLCVLKSRRRPLATPPPSPQENLERRRYTVSETLDQIRNKLHALGVAVVGKEPVPERAMAQRALNPSDDPWLQVGSSLVRMIPFLVVHPRL